MNEDLRLNVDQVLQFRTRIESFSWVVQLFAINSYKPDKQMNKDGKHLGLCQQISNKLILFYF